MAENSKISWCHHTFNPWVGCTKVSDGCKFCYAETLMDKRWGKVEWGPQGERKRTSETYWRQPERWNRRAKREGVRYRVFCGSLCDVFEDKADQPELGEWRRALLKIIVHTPHLDWLLLTKRPENVNRMIERATGFSESDMWFHAARNVWIGTSVEDQASADKRIPHLLRVPAQVRFLSCEPLLGPIDLGRSVPCGYYCDDALGHVDHPFWTPGIASPIHWVIVGGESGPNARVCSLDWIYDLMRQCHKSDVACFVKQLGSVWASLPGANDYKGGDMSEWPEGLRVRQFPQ